MLNHLKNATNVAYTTNGARAYATTQSYLVDFFATGGALRTTSENDKIKLFSKAFAENPLLAMKALFYMRDIRGGQGERETFKTIIKYLAKTQTDVVEKNAYLIPHYGRYDDLLALYDTPAEEIAITLIRSQLRDDLDSKYPSLLAKWLPSENASSPKTKRLAKKTRIALGLTPREYRKTLSELRRRINVVERLMSAKDWSEIEYDKISSKAGLIYRNAFMRNDEDRYSAFIGSLKKGEKKVNAKTLFPYEIVGQYMGSMTRRGNHYHVGFSTNRDEILEAMWNNLPDYVGDNFDNALAVVDTSGSMSGLPIQVALSLGLYIAERNKGAYHNHFITFSERPQLQEVIGSHLGEKLNNMASAEWQMNTNIEKVFDLVLNTAIRNRVPQEELPSKLFIISDMQFDYCVRGSKSLTVMENIKRRFERAGYTMPELVFWNVNASSTNFPVKVTDTGVALVSGCSPSLFKNLLAGKDMTPYGMMLDVLNSDRYDLVEV
jgi:hypothetical protein